jgi:hypothetical protein
MVRRSSGSLAPFVSRAVRATRPPCAPASIPSDSQTANTCENFPPPFPTI